MSPLCLTAFIAEVVPCLYVFLRFNLIPSLIDGSFSPE